MNQTPWGSFGHQPRTNAMRSLLSGASITRQLDLSPGSHLNQPPSVSNVRRVPSNRYLPQTAWSPEKQFPVEVQHERPVGAEPDQLHALVFVTKRLPVRLLEKPHPRQLAALDRHPFGTTGLLVRHEEVALARQHDVLLVRVAVRVHTEA